MNKLSDIPNPEDLAVDLHEAPRLVTIFTYDDEGREMAFVKFLATIAQTDEIIEIAESKSLLARVEILSTKEQAMMWVERL